MNEMNNLPQHVAIIMDGNGRWAKKRLLPRTLGHKAGVDTVKRIAIKASDMGIKLLTLYAFSTENWGRPDEEVNYIMDLPKLFFKSFLPELMANNVKVDTIGDITALPPATLAILNDAVVKTRANTGLILNFAINYGGHEDILYAVRQMIVDIQQGELGLEDVSAKTLDSRLMTGKYGDVAHPDLMIRTSGELRLSNFLSWQLAYSELYFTDILWPDFSAADFEEAVRHYSQRQRRFGKI